ncbi:MAG TPA: hypothetical protein VFH11_08315 [Gemmatimonadota bacterium]|nr:hypothetical protein [Gemmatimonadota bacterium]
MERRTSPSRQPDDVDADDVAGRGGEASPGRSAPEVRCPHCDSRDVELEAAFGGSLMSSQFYCRGCRTVFEWVKWESAGPSDWLE